MEDPRAVTARPRTPANAVGAIALIELSGDARSLDAALARLGVGQVAVGELRLKMIAGVDQGVVARVEAETAWLMPHGGVAVVRAMLGACEAQGVAILADGDPTTSRPPRDLADIESLATDALARAASPLAVDALLRQPGLWRDALERDPDAVHRPPTARDRVLSRLIDPPLVVVLGASNIGKSTLTNALAGRGVSIVADEPGTTRDHVGVLLDMAGLVVRWLDTPGLRDHPTPEEAAARDASLELARRADLIILASDPTTDAPTLDPSLETRAPAILHVGLRSDLANPSRQPSMPPSTLRVSARTGDGIPALVQAVRQTLLPVALNDPEPWRFWP